MLRLNVAGADAISSELVDRMIESDVLDRLIGIFSMEEPPKLEPNVALLDPGLDGVSERPSSSLRVSFSWYAFGSKDLIFSAFSGYKLNMFM